MSVGLDKTFNVGFAQPFGNNLNFGQLQQPANGLSDNSSIFNTAPLNSLQGVNNNYEDDFMMPEFLKVNTGNATAPEVLFADNSVSQNLSAKTVEQESQKLPYKADDVNQELKNYSLDFNNKDMALTEFGNPYKETDVSKKTLALLGFTAPIAGKCVQLSKGGKFAELFKIKQLAVACPMLALAGYGIGSLIDSFINNQRAKAADSLLLAKNMTNSSKAVQE